MEKLVNILVDATAYIADTFGNSILGLLTMDVGSGKSFFDLVFSSIGNFYHNFVIIAIAFLLINYVWQLAKMMFLAQGANDTPLGLTAWTIIAGCLIYAGRPIIYFFEGFFNVRGRFRRRYKHRRFNRRSAADTFSSAHVGVPIYYVSYRNGRAIYCFRYPVLYMSICILDVRKSIDKQHLWFLGSYGG